jgi:hypothetical protein
MQFSPVGSGVQAEQPDRAGVRFAEADGAFDGGGLARPVRSQDAEDLPFGHRHRDVVHRDQVSAGLTEVADLHRG